MSYPDQATASIAQFLFRDSAGAMYIIPRRAFHNGSQYGDTVTIVQDLSGNGNDLTGTAVFDRRSFFGGNVPLDSVRDAQFIRDVNMSAPLSGMGTTIRAVPGGSVMFDEGVLDGAITGEFSVLILIDRTLSEREKHVVSELARLWGGANWTPGSLFTDGKDGIWLDPSDHSTLWIDEDRIQNATQPGDVVWHIDDKSGNENHFSVDASANRARLVRWPASAVREGGVRNLLVYSEPTSNTGWSGVNVAITGAGDGWSRVTKTQSEDSAWAFQEAFLGDGEEIRTGYVRVRQGNTRYVWLTSKRIAATNNSRSIIFDFEDPGFTRTAIVGATPFFENLGDGSFLIGYPAPTGTASSDGSFGIGPCTHPTEQQTDVPIGAYVDFTRAQVNTGEEPLPYQRVGAGQWDVTEEGQPDCWGLLGNGVNTRYTSERGIPEYVDGEVRMLVGQTKFRDPGILLANTGSSSAAGVTVLSNPWYQGRVVNGEGTTLIASGATGPLPDSAVLDSKVRAQSTGGEVTIRRSTDAESTSENSEAFAITSARWGLLDYVRSTPSAVVYDGIIWSTILTAYEPDETLWSQAARDWLNSVNMPGVLDDD